MNDRGTVTIDSASRDWTWNSALSDAIAQGGEIGASVLYQERDGKARLLALSLSGGPTRQLVKCAKPTAFACQRIYYVACGSDRDPAVHVMDLSPGQDRLIGRLERYSSYYYPMGLPVSPDGTTILYNKVVNDGADLMLIENFR